MKLEIKDVLYFVTIAIFVFFMLAQIREVPLSSYAPLADAKAKEIVPTININYLPVFEGILLSSLLYFILRTRFRSLSAFIAVLLTVTSGAFIKGFVFGSFSFPVALLFGQILLPISVSLQNLSDTIFMLPFALFILCLSLYKKLYNSIQGMIVTILSLISVASAFVFPLLAVPFLTFCIAYTLDMFKENREEDILIGFFIVFGITISLAYTITPIALALSLLSSIIIFLLLYLTNLRHRINILLILALVFVSIVGSATNSFSIQRIDRETVEALSQLSQVQGRIAIASIYDEISHAAYYLSGRNVDSVEGLRYAFSEDGERNFDYLLIDTLILDNPKKYAAKVNSTAKFETFWYVSKSKIKTEEMDYTVAVFQSLSSRMLMTVDDNGRPQGSDVIIGTERVSRFLLFYLNATDGYSRYINPRDDSDRNILKILFPEQFLFNESKLIWQSSTSRMRLYRFG